MKENLKQLVEAYVLEHTSEAEHLLVELGKIPAPSHQEGRRAEFCRDWLIDRKSVV